MIYSYALKERINCNKRLYGDLYSSHRIAMRTAGMEMPEQKFVIAGLGSIGSNLVYFLNGWNNASFTLIDNDRFRTENIDDICLDSMMLVKTKWKQ